MVVVVILVMVPVMVFMVIALVLFVVFLTRPIFVALLPRWLDVNVATALDAADTDATEGRREDCQQCMALHGGEGSATLGQMANGDRDQAATRAADRRSRSLSPQSMQRLEKRRLATSTRTMSAISFTFTLLHGCDECTCVTGLGRLESFSFSQPSRANSIAERPDPSSATPIDKTFPPTTNAYRLSRACS